MTAEGERRVLTRGFSLTGDVDLNYDEEKDDSVTSISDHLDGQENGDNLRKLILHFDARNTVFVADIFSRITVEQALNTYLSGLVWGIEDEDGKWTRLSSELSLLAPRSDAVSLYKHMERKIVKVPEDRGTLRKVLGEFTQSADGSLFESVFHHQLQQLRWPSGEKEVPGLTVKGKDGSVYHYLLPAFLSLIDHMRQSGREFCVVVRTFGRDAPHILNALEKYVAGEHPLYRGPRNNLSVNLDVHRFKRLDEGSFEYTPGSDGDVLTTESEIYEHWNRCEGVVAVVDDFEYWQQNQYHYTAAKPLWFSQRDHRVQHILFDDNIRVRDADNILNLCRLVSVNPENANPRGRIHSAGRTHTMPLMFTDCRSTSPRRACVDLEPVLASRYEDVFFVQANLMESIGQQKYFIDKVEECEANFDRLFSSAR